MSTVRTMRRGCALLGVGVLVGFANLPAAAVADGSSGDVSVVNTETVQVYMSPSAAIQTKRVYEQLAMTGKGRVDLLNPVSTKGLRNLDGFAGITTKGGEQVVRTTVEGSKKTRSVSDFTGQLPLDVDVTYTLNGKTVKPGDVVGKSGRLGVDFTVRNVTGRTQEISYADGKGGKKTEQADVVIPIVGSVTTTVPSSFTEVASKQANMAGDGQGGTKMSFTMTLFPPVGTDTARFGYTAKIADGVVPRVDITALPVNPLESPTFKSAADSYQGGADTGAKLTDGAVQIDDNLLKLRDGSAQLLAGILKLQDGANQLSDGLNDNAAPGAAKLADGASKLDIGLGKLRDGSGKLRDGSGQLEDGTDKALAGSKKLTGGLQQISTGLGQLADVNKGLPTASDGITQLKSGIDKLIGAMGNEADAATQPKPKTIIGGLTKLKVGLDTQLVPGSTKLAAALKGVRGTGEVGTEAGGIDGIKNGLDGAQKKLGPKVADGGSADQLVLTLQAIKGDTTTCSGTCQARVSALIDGATQSKIDLTALNQGLIAAVGGLGKVVAGFNDPDPTKGLISAATAINGGLLQTQDAVNGLKDGSQQVAGGLGDVRGGLLKLADGVTKAVTGISQLNTGASQAYDGSGTLTSGLGQLDDGAGKLSDGADQLATGAGDAKDGSGQLAAGADKLSSGLGDAADGSKKIAGGLDQAADAAPQLPDGAQRLSKEGTKQLIGAGESTTQTYAANVAVIEAGAQRADTGSMAYGAPKGAEGLTAYSYIIKGDDGEKSSNLIRTVGGLGLLGAAGGVLLLRRRLG